METLSVAEDWVPKELTLVARSVPASVEKAGRLAAARRSAGRRRKGFYRLHCPRIGWLGQIADMARELAAQRELGLFGTSIAATWLFAELEGGVGFFVDEDPQRVGNAWQGRPVYHPRQIPTGSRLLIPLPLALAGSISRRIARPDLEIVCPGR